MTQETRKRKRRWLRHVAWVLGAKIFLIAAGLTIFFGSGLGNPILQRFLVRRLASVPGTNTCGRPGQSRGNSVSRHSG